jgi:enamine deaminase RidA (YjgF/YER057c/UK114 family)
MPDKIPPPLPSGSTGSTGITNSSSTSSTGISTTKAFLSLVDPLRNFAKFECGPSTATSKLLASFSRSASSAVHIPSSASTAPTSSSPPSQGKDNNSKLSLDEYISFLNIMPKIGFPDICKNLEEMNAHIIDKMEDLVRGNLKVLIVGAGLGAAICAGVGIGLFMAVQMLQSMGNPKAIKSVRSTDQDQDNDNTNRRSHWWNFMNRSTQRLFRPLSFRGAGDVPRLNGVASTEGNHYHDGLKIIKGCISSISTCCKEPLCSSKDPQGQCQQCLDSITVALGKERLSWDRVLRINIHLVEEKCDAKVFRDTLKGYPVKDEMPVSIVYVQKLEDEHAFVEIEALVQC